MSNIERIIRERIDSGDGYIQLTYGEAQQLVNYFNDVETQREELETLIQRAYNCDARY